MRYLLAWINRAAIHDPFPERVIIESTGGNLNIRRHRFTYNEIENKPNEGEDIWNS